VHEGVRTIGTAQPTPQDQFRALMGTVVEPVVIVTGQDDRGRARGFTVSSFSSVSLDPPLVLFCVRTVSTTWAQMAPQGGFVINMLRADQHDLAARFAGPGDRFEGVAQARTSDGLPVIQDSLAALVCSIEDGLRAGDHEIIVGRVLRACQGPAAMPLAYHGGAYASVRPHASEDVLLVS
jgi:3-hydroxy-9,10-secoandrosta-1,3,5(10)-triene-9,17-dione monooxygenase reductase component